MPLISVIVTTYNRKELLSETIDSILNQTFTDFELIVVDNFSNYNYFELIESFNDSRIVAYQNANSGVIAINRNFGIKKATGKYLAFCDDDDIWYPEKLETQIQAFNNSLEDENELALVYCNAICFGEGIKTYQSQKKQILNCNDLIERSDIFFSSILVSASNLISFDESKEVTTAEDFKLIIDLFFNGYKFKFIEKPYIQYRIANNSNLRKRKAHSYILKLYLFSYMILKYDSNDVNKKVLFKSIILLGFKYYLSKNRI